MSMLAGGSETTLEDRIIYDPDIMPLIDQAERRIRGLVEGSIYLRPALETLVFSVVKHERGL